MRNEYEAFIDAIETATTNAVEYETSHDDSGSNYLHMIADSLVYNNGERRLADWLALHDIEVDCSEVLEYCLEMDLIEPVTGSVFGPSGVKPFYSTDEYHASAPTSFLCASFGIEEVETQLELHTLTNSQYAGAFARKAEDDNRVCTRFTKGQHDLLSYEATDAVWFFTIELESITDWMEQQA